MRQQTRLVERKKGQVHLSWQPQRSRQQLLVMSASPVKFRRRGGLLSLLTLPQKLTVKAVKAAYVGGTGVSR